MTRSDNDMPSQDEEADSPEVEAMERVADLVEHGEYEDMLLANDVMDELVHDVASQMASDAINDGKQIEFLLAHGWTLAQIQEAVQQHAPSSTGPTDDLNDLLGVEAEQMIAAREAADAALANRDVDLLAAALERMGVPAEDGPDRLAQALLAVPPAVQHRQLDQIEVLNTLPRDQAAVLAHQHARTGTRPNSAAPRPGHPARVAAAAVEPTDATEQRNRPDIGDRAEVVPRSPNPRPARPDRRSTPRR